MMLRTRRLRTELRTVGMAPARVKMYRTPPKRGGQRRKNRALCAAHSALFFTGGQDLNRDFHNFHKVFHMVCELWKAIYRYGVKCYFMTKSVIFPRKTAGKFGK